MSLPVIIIATMSIMLTLPIIYIGRKAANWAVEHIDLPEYKGK